MRGKDDEGRLKLHHVGITPAYAGKRSTSLTFSQGYWDHPRVCGEKPDRILWEHWKEGSPPRMRGKVSKRFFLGAAYRITPAYAGKSSSKCPFFRAIRDHPRVCGEKLSTTSTLGSSWGSPPRMRGKELRNQLSRMMTWITPAYAGKSRCPYRLHLRLWDHPRVCGEKTKKIP